MASNASGSAGEKGGGGAGGAGSEYVSTIEILHKHTVGASRKEKLVLPIVLVVVGLILAAVLYVGWDHKTRDYTVVASVQDVLKAAERPLAMPSGLQALLNPGDAQYLAFSVKSWQYWAGKGAVTSGYYLHMPELKAESMETLVRGERGAATVTFHLDLAKSKRPDFSVIEIVRGGVVIPEESGNLQIFPLAVADKPLVSTAGADGAFMESHTFAWDREATFRDAGRFITMGRLQKGDQGLWIQAKGFNVTLESGMEPGLLELLTDLVGTKKSETATYYLDLRKKALPADRQGSHSLGTARLVGVDFGKFYVANGA